MTPLVYLLLAVVIVWSLGCVGVGLWLLRHG